ncbi:hypothetical protein DL93DRAFT_2080973 [Clavulina sp. PMI_390]|nr:hypothetical protein DL93DRAFT_2080973 [Clavulina sp. PMI_390]
MNMSELISQPPLQRLPALKPGISPLYYLATAISLTALSCRFLKEFLNAVLQRDMTAAFQVLWPAVECHL